MKSRALEQESTKKSPHKAVFLATLIIQMYPTIEEVAFLTWNTSSWALTLAVCVPLVICYSFCHPHWGPQPYGMPGRMCPDYKWKELIYWYKSCRMSKWGNVSGFYKDKMLFLYMVNEKISNNLIFPTHAYFTQPGFPEQCFSCIAALGSLRRPTPDKLMMPYTFYKSEKNKFLTLKNQNALCFWAKEK